MSTLTVSLIALVIIFGAALLGMFLRRLLPDDHVLADSRGLVMLSTGLVGTMAALVLGLMISSAKDFYDVQRNDVTALSAKVILLDRILGHYGPEANDIRVMLRAALSKAAERIWPEDVHTHYASDLQATIGREQLYDRIAALKPQDESQKFLQSQAFNAAMEIGATRWLMFEQLQSSQISTPMLVILISWFAIIFVSYGIYTPPNRTVIAALFLCAMSVSGAIFLVLSLYRPFDGILRISSAPVQQALEFISR